jgi:hypothetical protein
VKPGLIAAPLVTFPGEGLPQRTVLPQACLLLGFTRCSANQ